VIETVLELDVAISIHRASLSVKGANLGAGTVLVRKRIVGSSEWDELGAREFSTVEFVGEKRLKPISNRINVAYPS
jgi:uncharacterized lipoprotein